MTKKEMKKAVNTKVETQEMPRKLQGRNMKKKKKNQDFVKSQEVKRKKEEELQQNKIMDFEASDPKANCYFTKSLTLRNSKQLLDLNKIKKKDPIYATTRYQKIHLLTNHRNSPARPAVRKFFYKKKIKKI